ncbi:hypothetical protein G3485_20230 [Shewanella baltica]|uniref:hypothetical protein n=1 Tax=Shewanella baltica TaxID=62322 RepID=UPI00217D0A03|nr:hypothetical protein [Shewanella baltica]MCS6129320.1 hypothetical protein [Shewanella baltica]MCS6141367.1 hypothetical protein [Shewanella baltica]MCS6147587.1 hypothetical protein [Shewanella baltica]MCS6172181.1 hypothetical protein [Shewanella baltica]MCS6189341.1 hypothetical protein [Shewanella baltica]
MNKGRTRGSSHGLLQNREDTKKKNTEALWKQIERLRKEKSAQTWSFKEIWSGAGLKSNMALNSPWNIHVRDAIETHNKNIREGLASGKLALEHKRTFRDDNRNLRKQLKDMELQRNMALESIAIYQTECDELKKEVRRLESRINRLKQ